MTDTQQALSYLEEQKSNLEDWDSQHFTDEEGEVITVRGKEVSIHEAPPGWVISSVSRSDRAGLHGEVQVCLRPAAAIETVK